MENVCVIFPVFDLFSGKISVAFFISSFRLSGEFDYGSQRLDNLKLYFPPFWVCKASEVWIPSHLSGARPTVLAMATLFAYFRPWEAGGAAEAATDVEDEEGAWAHETFKPCHRKRRP